MKRSKLKLEQSSHILKNISQRSSKNNNRNMIHSYMQDYSARDNLNKSSQGGGEYKDMSSSLTGSQNVGKIVGQDRNHSPLYIDGQLAFKKAT